MNEAEALRAALRCGRSQCPCAKGRNVHCPAHNDRSPSLTVDHGRNGPVWNCKTGCAKEAVTAALSERGLWPPTEIPQSSRSSGMRLVKEYEYAGADGSPIAYHGRFESPEGKTFRWRTAEGTWRDGLGFPEHDLPLYNLDQLIARPDDTVWFVEGEKAADACIDHGLLAVSLGGGASQQRFGTALDALSGRRVVLWGDNDDAGRALMDRIAGYFPDALTVAPTLPKGGDAYDYFASGGTVEALQSLAQELQPQARVVDHDSIEVAYPLPGGTLQFSFWEFWAAARELSASFKVTADYPGLRNIEYPGRLNLRSVSTRNSIRLDLEKVFETKDLPWAKALAVSCGLAETAWLGIDTSVDITDVAPARERSWLVERWAPRDVVTCLFGMGGSGKSLLALDLALHCLFDSEWLGRTVQPVKGFTVLDYEDHEDEWRMRADQLCAVHGWTLEPGMFRYEPGRGIPVIDQVRLRERMEARGHGLLIVDSAISAVGGRVLDEAAVATCLNRLNDLGRAGITSLLIAHVTKAEESQYPFGSIFWHNLVRGSHFVESHQADGSATMDLLMWNRKANRGKQRPVSLRIRFPQDDGPIHISQPSSGDNAVTGDQREEGRGRVKAAVLSAMQRIGRPARVEEIESVSGERANVIRNELAKMLERDEYVVKVGRDGPAVIWALREESRVEPTTKEYAPGAHPSALGADGVVHHPPFLRGVHPGAHSPVIGEEKEEPQPPIAPDLEGPAPWE